MAKKNTEGDWQKIGSIISGLFVIAIVIKLVELYLWWIKNLRDVAVGIFLFCCSLFIIIVSINYMRSLWISLVVEPIIIAAPSDTEPAFKPYFFARRVFSDYWNIVSTSSQKSWTLIDYSWRPARFILPDLPEIESKNVLVVILVVTIFVWPLLLAYFATILGCIFAGVSLYVIFGLIHFLVLGACILTVYLLAYLLRAVTGALAFGRRILSKEEIHPDCGGRMRASYYECPTCKAKHKLLPGIYGIFKRQCECGAWLPTLDALGRSGLIRYCSNCDRPANPSRFAKIREIKTTKPGETYAGRLVAVLWGGCFVSCVVIGFLILLIGEG